MPGELEASQKELKRVFSNDYAFNIPPYQRPYAWTTVEAGELLEDLHDSVRDTGDVADHFPYFLGSIVLIKDPGRPEADVVDGQQRLTTLTILISVLRELAEMADADRLHAYVCEAGNKYEGTKDRFRLTLRPRDAEFLRRFIQERGGLQRLPADAAKLPDAQANIRANALHLRQKLEAMSAGARDRLAQFMMQRCYLVVVSASDRESAYRIFSVMNDRGLDLSPTDILKADIIGAIDGAEQEHYTDEWEGIEEALGRDRFTELFAHIRMIHVKRKQQRSLTAEFLDDVRPLEDPRGFIDDYLAPMADAFEVILDASYQSDRLAESINRYLRYLNQLDNFDWVPVALKFLVTHEGKPEALLAFLKDLERLAYGMFIIRIGVTQRIGRYAEVLRAMELGGNLQAVDSPLQLTADELEAIRRALDGEIYLMTRVRLPVLLRLDALLSDGGTWHDHEIISIEHVLPQQPEENSEWCRDFIDQEQRDRWTHRLANLVLLSRRKNSQAQNFDFERKKREYFMRAGVSTFALTSQVLNQPRWTPEVLDRRQRSLIDALVTEWRLNR